MKFILCGFILSVLIGKTPSQAVFNIVGAFLSVPSLARLLAERLEIVYQRFLASAPQMAASPWTKNLSRMAESSCFDRVEGQACGHSS